jgi:hypothetical protein
LAGDIEQVRRMLTEQTSLRVMIDRDPEQEIRGGAIRVLDAAVASAREVLGSDPVVSVISDVISPEAFEAGEPLRAADVLLVIDALLGALPPQDWGSVYRRRAPGAQERTDGG